MHVTTVHALSYVDERGNKTSMKWRAVHAAYKYNDFRHEFGIFAKSVRVKRLLDYYTVAVGHQRRCSKRLTVLG